jgi:hypothetical protein
MDRWWLQRDTLSRYYDEEGAKRQHVQQTEGKNVPHIDQSILDAVVNVDPIRLAILFVGLTSLGVIWLASIIIKHLGRKR